MLAGIQARVAAIRRPEAGCGDGALYLSSQRFGLMPRAS